MEGKVWIIVLFPSSIFVAENSRQLSSIYITLPASSQAFGPAVRLVELRRSFGAAKEVSFH